MAENASAATEAFSKQAPEFDAIDAQNPLIGRMRKIVRDAALRYMQPGSSVLELNAGTGIDSLFFASKGMCVLATDGALGMVEELRKKAATMPAPVIDVAQCSFLHLDQLAPRTFDHVFSNFGGLNCTSDLDKVLSQVDGLLAPNGTCTLVIMPRFSPWEVASALKGNFKLAARRWKKNGTQAHLEGVIFPCFYYSPSYVIKHLGTGYRVVAQRALSLVVPPPHMESFPKKWPTLLMWLHGIEERIGGHWPFRNWGDHFLIILEKKP